VALVARLADGGTAPALVLLVLTRTHDTEAAGLLTASVTLPQFAAGPAMGALAARSRRVAAPFAAALAGYALALLGLAILVGRAPVLVCCLIAACAGTLGPLLFGALSALVPEEAGPRGYAWDALTYNVAGIAGPALVALLAGTGSAMLPTLTLAVALFAGAPLTLRLTGPNAAPTERTRGTRGGIGRVTRVVLGAPELLASTVATTLSAGSTGGLTIALVLMARELGRTSAAGATLLAAFATGALIGSLCATRWRPGRPFGTSTLLACSMLAMGAMLAATAAAPAYPAALALVALAGWCDGPLLTATLLLRAVNTPSDLRTELFATTAGLKIGAAAAGAAATGAAATLGGRWLLLAIALAQPAAVVAGGAAAQVGRVRNAARTGDRAPCPAPRSG
jgi:MFS family permease